MNQSTDKLTGWRLRYSEAHYKYYCEQYPSIVSDGYYTLPAFPLVTTSNGLTNAIVKYLGWVGAYGNRINTTGRVIKAGRDIKSVGGGTIVAKTVMIKGTTKKGTPDISVVLNGYAIFIEIKMKDKQSPDQMKQEQAIQRAGGYYFIVRDMETFFSIYDKFMNAPKLTIF
jgi:hypothetical protein